MRNGLEALVTVTKSTACRRTKMIQRNTLWEKGFFGSESLEISTHVLKKTRYLALRGCLRLSKTATRAAREKFGIERHGPITLTMRSCVEIALNTRRRMRAGQLITERDPARIPAFRAVRFFVDL